MDLILKDSFAYATLLIPAIGFASTILCYTVSDAIIDNSALVLFDRYRNYVLFSVSTINYIQNVFFNIPFYITVGIFCRSACFSAQNATIRD